MAALAREQAATSADWGTELNRLTQRVGKSEAERAEANTAHEGDIQACRKL